jgi:hypothetical protein
MEVGGWLRRLRLKRYETTFPENQTDERDDVAQELTGRVASRAYPKGGWFRV